MIWFALGVVAMLLVLFMLGACKVAGDADEAAERWVAPDGDEPRCDVTAQPLTMREPFERECD